ncbi:PhnD/SsuA/transferrin family substrate-binding protein [Calothrix sp. FACHB-1219]|uniref:phosphate/phosphite/phosphonate ABC transporter substrate-binding protein n=1 Tax=unclassified Calothrix TaxID=2619626 RepID=UPI001681CADA|nr:MULTISPECIES: PhnD/SsuA/transferrin family substrate-binding protein [unclassified Calothrix]MBD2203495.1 PhnD/SsuA/transferrin family substrate-binding protein [Calothrix sp. FACHB-168]MBD2219087.1 PhnD/SsuA/transferrin family substrate-binding protein [Calothrix sp. FACHB-1219]
MSWKLSRRVFLFQMLFLAMHGCKSKSPFEGALTIGSISYGGGEEIITQYAKFNRHLAEKTKSHIKLEPAFNENKAAERLEARAWDLVFAPPGLAAIAIARYQYVPIFPLVGVSNLRSVFVVRKDNPIAELKQLQNQIVALGQVGSATGYYFPLFNLYGMTLSEIIFAPTPQTVMEWVAVGKAAAGAVSIAEYNLYSSQLQKTQFRILHTDVHYVPSGVVLIGPNVERNRQEYIRKVMNEFPSSLAQEVGYVPNGTIPDYQYMISVVERVKLITPQLQTKPVRLFVG